MILLQVCDLDDVFIVVVEVFACHTPDEGVVVGGRSCVDRPFRRHDGLFVVEPYHTAFLRFAHDVADGLVGGQVEVIVSFDATAVRVRWHRVPHTTLLQLRQTHLQLAGAFLERVSRSCDRQA